MFIEKPKLKFIQTRGLNIIDQLKLEEYLLRDTKENYCLLNFGTQEAIVMGISGKPDELIHLEECLLKNIPVIKRFSGGGTVVCDPNTIFVTFIFNSSEIKVPCFPEPIYRFTEKFYKDVFKRLEFEFKQNDYIINDRKIGGNAQYIKKDRWLHHTSFLWDYNPILMQLLKHPKKTPEYRQNRSHQDFITCLKNFMLKKEDFFESIYTTLNQFFDLETLGDVKHYQASRISTEVLDIENLLISK